MQGSTEASTSRLPEASTTPASASSTSRASSESASNKGKSREAAGGPSHQKPQEWTAILKSGAAGGLAGCVAKTSVAPLDRVKILFQTASPQYEKYSGSWTGVFSAMGQIWREAGIRGLMQGHSVTLLRIYPYAGVKFMAYEFFHRLLMPTQQDITGLKLFTAGSASGLTSVILTYPLELVRVRLAYDRRLPPEQLGGRSAIMYSIHKIYHEGDPPRWATASSAPSLPSGSPSIHPHPASTPYFKNPSKAVVISSSLFQRHPVLKFYRGFVVSMIGMIPYAGTSFLVWGWLKMKIPLAQRKSSAVINLACGAAAGAAAQTASYPFEVVRRRMQVGGVLRPDRFFGFWETVQFIYNRKGWRGFYIGLSIGYLKVVPLTAISFATWEAVKKILNV